MRDAHRRRPDTSDVSASEEPDTGAEMVEFAPADNEEEGAEEAEIERGGADGEVFLLRPKRAANARNAPGAAATSTNGDIDQFRGIPYGRPEGTGKRDMGGLRGGKPGRLWRRSPGPFRQTFPGAVRGAVSVRKELGRMYPREKERTHIPGEAKNSRDQEIQMGNKYRPI